MTAPKMIRDAAENYIEEQVLSARRCCTDCLHSYLNIGQVAAMHAFLAGAIWATDRAAGIADRDDKSAWGIATEIRALDSEARDG